MTRTGAALLLLATGAATLLAPRPACAQAAPELRERLEAQRADRPNGVPEGTLTSIEYLLDTAERIDGGFEAQAAAWRARAARYLEAASEGRDPYPRAKGEIVNRGYETPVSTTTPGYAIYLPPDYDPSKRWPLYVALHGGSANGNLFLGVVLGNNMSWKKYKQHLWDEYEPRFTPSWIVVAPTGFGQIMWRWMGEKDVLDVIEDVRRHYSVDPNRVVLGGLSNGGVGAYSVGLRHAWRFSAVQAMAGAPSWVQYGGGERRFREAELRAVRPWSGLHLAENAVNTDFRYYHGRTDGGPMKPHFVERFSARLDELGIEKNVTWYDTGHDILYLVHRHGRIYEQLAEVLRDPRPREVRVVTGDYRASRQHWVTVTRIEGYPSIARVRAVADGASIDVTTDGVRAFALHLPDAPLEGETARIVVDGAEAWSGPRAQAGHRLHLVREGDGWRNGFPEPAEPGALEKRPGLSGPITDAYYDRMVHVYGTGDPDHTEALEKAAERGARGWPLWLWYFEQEVVADTEVTEKLARSAHLVLYGTADDNAVLDRIEDELPIRIEQDAVVVAGERHEGPDVGVRFVYPNPEAPERYVIVQGGVTTDAVRAGHKLPDFVPDYLVYDEETTSRRSRLATGTREPVTLGYFDDAWQLPQPDADAGDAERDGADGADEPAGGAPRGAGPEDGGPSESALPVPPAPDAPEPPTKFAAPATDPAGAAARAIARRVPTFDNYRAEIAGATWKVDDRARWRIRPAAACLAALREDEVPARPRPAQPTPVPAPVELLGPVEGVWFRSMHDDRPLLLSCEMARRLPGLARILAKHGVRGVDVMSAWRRRPRPSFHTMGLGLDLARFWTEDGWLSVARHYERTPDRATCEGPPPRDPKARTLRSIACALFRTGRFSSVLTPNYNEGHRDHLHLDARPADPRLFLR